MLVLDLDYALEKKVEQDLWNVGFKQQIEALQAISKDRKVICLTIPHIKSISNQIFTIIIVLLIVQNKSLIKQNVVCWHFSLKKAVHY